MFSIVQSVFMPTYIRPALFLSMAVAAIAMQTSVAHAASITITNPSFETHDPFNSDGYNFAAPGWVTTPYDSGNNLGSGTQLVSALSGTYSGYDGANFAFNYTDSTTLPSTTYQMLSTTLASNMQYNLSALVARRSDGPPFNGYQVALLAGSSLDSATLLAEDNNSLAATLNASPGVFSTSSVTYTSPSTGGAIGQNLIVELIGNPRHPSDPAAGNQALFDNVQLNATAVPEPASLLLIGGAAAMLLRRRRPA